MLGFLISLVLASEFIVLDDLEEGFSRSNGQICDKHGTCFPEIFQPSKEFKRIFKGQKVPKGLHITMDYTTGEKMAKLLNKKDESSIDSQAGAHSTPNIHHGAEKDPSTNLRQLLTLQEKDTLTGLFSNLNTSKPAEIISKTLGQLADVAHHFDVGVGIAQNKVQVNHLVLLLSHESEKVRAQVSILFGTILSNNDVAQKLILEQRPSFIMDLLSALANESDTMCKNRIIYALSAMLRGNADAIKVFTTLKPYEILGLLAEDVKLSTRVFTLINDIGLVFPSPYIDQICSISKTMQNNEARVFHETCSNHISAEEL